MLSKQSSTAGKGETASTSTDTSIVRTVIGAIPYSVLGGIASLGAANYLETHYSLSSLAVWALSTGVGTATPVINALAAGVAAGLLCSCLGLEAACGCGGATLLGHCGGTSQQVSRLFIASSGVVSSGIAAASHVFGIFGNVSPLLSLGWGVGSGLVTATIGGAVQKACEGNKEDLTTLGVPLLAPDSPSP